MDHAGPQNKLLTGTGPSCSQCVNVGFECKTSDKLSRRAFPRGYTESLEERVRCLEAEVRELKELLDEKDEKIDMLSRMHSNSPQAFSARRPSLQSDSGVDCKQETEQTRDDVFKVVQSPFLLDDENLDSYFVGTSSGRTLIGTIASMSPALHTNDCRCIQTQDPGDWTTVYGAHSRNLLRH